MALSHSAKRRRVSPDGAADGPGKSVKQFYNNASEWDLEQDYERRARKLHKKEKEKTRLPIKTTEGSVKHVEEPTLPSDDSDSPFVSEDEEQSGAEGEDAEGDGEAEKKEEEEEKPKIPLKQQIIQTKEELAYLATIINEDPEEQVGQFKRMLEMITHDTHPSIKKLSMAAMAAIYKDVIPGYRIRPLSEAEKNTKLSKEVRKLRDFEQTLLTGYHNYIKQLLILSTVKTGEERKDAQGLKSVAVACAANLLQSVSHFNFRGELLKIVVAQLGRSITPEFVKARETLVKIFEEDEDGVVSMEAVSMISKMLKTKSFRVHETVIDMFLHLRLLSEFYLKASKDKVDKQEEEQPHGKKKKQEKVFRTKKERKVLKKQKEVEKDMREADATVSHEHKDKMQAETLKIVFGIYFRILKQRVSRLMGAVLEGLAKYAHLINQDFFGDLLEALKELIEQTDAPIDDKEDQEGSNDDDEVPDPTGRNASREALLCAITAFALLEGQDATKAASTLQLDLNFFITHIYRTLFPLSVNPDIEFHPSDGLRLPDPDDKNDERTLQAQRNNRVNYKTPMVLLLRCLDSTLLAKGPKAPPPLRAAAFTKRLMTIVLQLPEKSAVALLALLIRSTKSNARKITPLWNTEDRKGDGVFVPNAPTVEGSNVFASTVWENELLRLHYCPQVREAAKEVEKIIASVL